MKATRRYLPRRVEVQLIESTPATWPLFHREGQEIARGTEYRYSVIDHNFKSQNEWVFQVRVPTDGGTQVPVYPMQHPPKKVLAQLDRRSAVFVPCTSRWHLGEMYCKVHLADVSGQKNWLGVRDEDRSYLPHWFKAFRESLFGKHEVARSKGTDGNSLVCTVRNDDHVAMIRLYFAMRAWVLQEKFSFEHAVA
jgi:hypothetical protein